MKDEDIKYLFRDRKMEMETVLDHLSSCLLIVQHYQSRGLRKLIEQAMFQAQSEFDAAGNRKLN
jgi:hypothetical protein